MTFIGKFRAIIGLCLLSISSAYSQEADSLRFKIGQMIVCGFEGRDMDLGLAITVSRHFVGGTILFEKSVATKGDRNIVNPQQVKTLTSSLQDISIKTLFMAVDQEGGRVSRLNPKKGFLPTVSAAKLGQIDNPDTTRFYAAQQAKQLQKYGFNLNFAPCVDLAVNPQNDIIVKLGRSYGNNVDVVVRNAQIVIDEQKKAGIISCVKHFPGHGSSASDSHLGFVDITDTWSEREIEPFKKLIKNGFNDIIMVGHLINRKFDTLPASLSKTIIDTILRQQLGYNGVVAVDDMNMGAISEYFEYEDALEKAVNAGVDMIIIGNNSSHYRPRLPEVTIVTLLDLVEKGKISRQRIEQAYRRIETLKKRLD